MFLLDSNAYLATLPAATVPDRNSINVYLVRHLIIESSTRICVWNTALMDTTLVSRWSLIDLELNRK